MRAGSGSYNRVSLLIVWVVCIGFSARVQAQDAYHTALLTQLETEYGVTGGEFVMSNSEAGIWGRVFHSGNTSPQTISVSGQSFTSALRLNVPVRGQNPWSSFIGFTLAEEFSEGDAGLLVVWARGISAERSNGLINANVEMNRSPWVKSLVTGLIPSSEWQQWLIPFEAAIDHQTSQVQLIFHLGIMAQQVEMGGITLINYGTAYTKEELPATRQDQDYTGREMGAAWRAEAEARIDQYRKRDVSIRIVDSRGIPVENASVQVKMNRHHFGFGSAIAVGMMLDSGPNGVTYRSKLADLTGQGHRFSTSVLENALKWGAWENNWPGTRSQKVNVIQQLKGLGMTVRGHNLVWPSWEFIPDDVRQFGERPGSVATHY